MHANSLFKRTGPSTTVLIAPLLLTSILFTSSALQAQALSVQFVDHDGSVAGLEQLVGNRTGKLIGSLEFETAETVLDFAWAFYSDDEVFVPVGGVTSHIFSSARAGLPMLTVSEDHPNVFPLDLPFGYGTSSYSFPPLPSGSYTLKLWVGQKGVFDQSGNNPPTGTLGVAQTGVIITQPAIVVWVENPRQLSEGSQAAAWLGASNAVSYDRLFVLQGEGVVHPGVEQMIIPANATISALFAVSVDNMASEGLITATDDAGFVWRSPQLASVTMTGLTPLGDHGGGDGVWSNSSYCSRTAGPKAGFPRTERSCGPCQNSTSPDWSTACAGILAGQDCLYIPHKCSWAFMSICFRRPSPPFVTVRVVVDKDEYVDCFWMPPFGPTWKQRCCDYRQIGTGNVVVPSCFNS